MSEQFADLNKLMINLHLICIGLVTIMLCKKQENKHHRHSHFIRQNQTTTQRELLVYLDTNVTVWTDMDIKVPTVTCNDFNQNHIECIKYSSQRFRDYMTNCM